MKYLCLAYGDPQKMATLSKAETHTLAAQCKLHDEELRRTGHLVSGQSLTWDVATIRPRDGKPIVTDGPFIETKERVGGLVVLEARDLNEAIRIASLHPAAHLGEHLGWAIEVRPIAEQCLLLADETDSSADVPTDRATAGSASARSR